MMPYFNFRPSWCAAVCRRQLSKCLCLLGWLCYGVIAFAAPATAAGDGSKRVALIVANETYESTRARGALRNLSNPKREGEKLSRYLSDLGWDVIFESDLDENKFVEALAEFENRADGAKRALFYYTGHGMQIGEKNYLMPVDAIVGCDQKGVISGVTLDRVFQAMRNVPQTAVLVDACRNNPLRNCPENKGDAVPQMSLARAKTKAARQLGPTWQQNSMIVHFATERGQTASDGLADDGSPYFKVLFDKINSRQGQSTRLLQLLQDLVGPEVGRLTKSQRPVTTHLGRASDFCFGRGPCRLIGQSTALALGLKQVPVTMSIRGGHLLSTRTAVIGADNAKVSLSISPVKGALGAVVEGYGFQDIKGDRISVRPQLTEAAHLPLRIHVFYNDKRIGQQNFSLMKSEALASIASRTPVWRAAFFVVDDYLDETIQDFGTAIDDVTDLANVLRRDYGFVTEVHSGRALTRDRVLSLLGKLFSEARETDNLLVYFFGKGEHLATPARPQLKRNFWLPADARSRVPGTPPAHWGWISLDTLADLAKHSRARSVLLLGDAETCPDDQGQADFEGLSPQSRRFALSRKQCRWQPHEDMQPLNPDLSMHLLASVRAKSRILIGGARCAPAIHDYIRPGESEGGSAFLLALKGALGLKGPRVFSGERLFRNLKCEMSQIDGSPSPVYLPLSSAGHSGGNFVFVRDRSPKRAKAADVAPTPN